jgi:predicted nucleic acid-binding protein
MLAPAFIDTNILLYAASDGRQDEGKTRMARALLRRRPWAVSMQVVQEIPCERNSQDCPGHWYATGC